MSKALKHTAYVTTNLKALPSRMPKIELMIMSEGMVQKLNVKLTVQALPENHESALTQAVSRMRRDRWKLVGNWRKTAMGYEAEVEQF